MQTPGAYISAVGHAGLIGWLVLGWGLSADPLDFEVAEVSVVSDAEYAALLAATTPQPIISEPATPDAPAVDSTPPTPQVQDAPTPAPAPEPTVAPAPEAPPPPAPEPPEAPREVSDAAPDAPLQPLPEAVAAPDLRTSPRPRPRPAPRVAPTPVAPPAPDAQIAEIQQDAVTQDAQTPTDEINEAQDATAPEEAATEIVTEAEEPSGAVKTSARPQSRPARRQPQTSTASSDNVNQADDAAVAAALADALAGTPSDAPAGPPLNASEQEGFRVAVSRCWIVDPGSEAARVQVTVSFALGRDGRVQGDVRQVAASGGSGGAINTAFAAARRAILRCGARGFDLPAAKYDQWKEVELTFDPSGMRLR